jgi:hypothetical protein
MGIDIRNVMEYAVAASAREVSGHVRVNESRLQRRHSHALGRKHRTDIVRQSPRRGLACAVAPCGAPGPWRIPLRSA